MTAFLASLSPLLIVSGGLVVLVFVLVFALANSSKKAGKCYERLKQAEVDRDALVKREAAHAARLPTDAELDAWMRGKTLPGDTLDS